MTVLTSEFQTIASWNDATHRVYLRARYRTSTVSGNSAHVLYQLLVNVNTQQSATSVNNAWALNGTGATSQSSSGGTFTLSGGDNVIAEIESGAITGGSNVSISGGYYMGYYNWGSTSLSGSATLPTFGGAPTDLSISNITPGYDTVTATVSVSGWGGLGDATSRYRELNVWAYDTGVSGGYRRYQKTYGDSLSSSITTNNSSEVQGSMDIVPNTRYILTTYASNGTYNTGQINSTNIVTLAAPATISLSSVTSSSATFNYTTGVDGGVYTKTIEYSIDGGTTWNTGATVSSGSASSGTFTVSGLDPSTAYVFKTRVSTTAGNTSNSDISFSTEGGFYGSVNGDAELVEKMYGPVNVVGDLQLKGDTTQNGTPTPDAPVAINVVTGNQIITMSDGDNQSQSYEVNLGKNLFDKENANALQGYFNPSYTQIQTLGYNAIVYIPCEPSTTYTVQRARDGFGRSMAVGYTTTLPTVGTQVYSITTPSLVDDIAYSTITTGADAKYLVARVYHNTQDTLTFAEVLATIQIEKGSTATSYAPYFTPIELCKLGTYQDYIYRNNGNWYLHKTVGKTVYNGTENDWSTNMDGSYRQFYRTLSEANVDSIARLAVLSDMFVRGSVTNTWFVSGAAQTVFRQPEAGGILVASTVAEWQTWLSNNNVTIYYPVATPTDTQITNAALITQLDALGSSSTYGQDTIITVDGSLPAEVSANMVSAKEIIKLYGSVNGLTKRVL